MTFFTGSGAHRTSTTGRDGRAGSCRKAPRKRCARTRASAHWILGLLFVTAVLAQSASPASAQSQGERIESYAVQIVVERTGSLSITETIDYDFGPQMRHGIFRNIPDRVLHDERYDRIYPLEVQSVTGSPGTPAQYEVEDVEGHKRIKIGDPDRTITGRHTYKVIYSVDGAWNAFPSHDELYWNAIGAEWPVPIGEASVTVIAPATIARAACFSGPHGSTLPCPQAVTEGDTARFTATGLFPRQGLTVVVGLPKGAVPEPRPILDERWSLSRAFEPSPPARTGAAVLSLLVLGGIGGLLWRSGRDRRGRFQVDAAAGSASGEEVADSVLGRDGPLIQYEPPDGLRPGQVGTLIDEVAHPLDATATIVDLAARGYLKIQEIPKEGLFSKTDWVFHQIEDKDLKELKRYERVLLRGLFNGGSPVRLSDLRYEFATHLEKFQDALYDDAVDQGWFIARPDRVRGRWTVIAGIALAVSIAILVALAAFTHLALLGIPLVVGSLLLSIGAKRMPHRTAKGAAVLRRVQGFRRFIEQSEREQARFAENHNWFSEYLPYAIVFGATEKWARAFSALDDKVPSPNWYYGPNYYSTSRLCGSMGDFAVSTSGTLVSTPSGSGSSGFSGGSSGGGGGGGGGGSW